MLKQTLIKLIEANKPLVEAGVGLVDGVDGASLLEELNALGDDFHATLSVYCKMTGKNDMLDFDAAPEALERIFGWTIKRVPARKWNRETRQFEGIIENLYVWEEINSPTKFPPCLEGKVKEIGLSQPGRNDNGEQDYP